MAVLYAPAALADLEEIWDYTEQGFGRAQAERYLRTIATACTTVATDPGRGIGVDYIRPGYRKLPVNAHVIFFRATGQGDVEIIRILHQRMDVGRKLGPANG